MKKIVVLFALTVLSALTGCGTPCDAEGDVIDANNARCGVEVAEAAEGDEAAAAVECTEALATDATCRTACHTDVDCKAVAGEGNADFDAASSEATEYFACLLACA